jgi:hypothetical protein
MGAKSFCVYVSMGAVIGVERLLKGAMGATTKKHPSTN